MPIDMTCKDLLFAKPEPRRRVKGRKARAESKVQQSVRQQVMARDQTCRASMKLGSDFASGDGWISREKCGGKLEWAHMHSRRRAHTVNEPPEQRYTTATSLCLCTRHHAAYDAHQMDITALTRDGANGKLKFRWRVTP